MTEEEKGVNTDSSREWEKAGASSRGGWEKLIGRFLFSGAQIPRETQRREGFFLHGGEASKNHQSMRRQEVRSQKVAHVADAPVLARPLTQQRVFLRANLHNAPQIL
jgi:hypothetical protein